MKKKAFTLIELIAVLVILAILALIVTPLVMNIIKKARISADKRSIDAYGRSVELAIANYLLDNGDFPSDISQLTIEYSGDEVVCTTTQLNDDSSIYLSGCTVSGRNVDYAYGNNSSSSYTIYNEGDEVTYNNVDYYVIKDSDTTEDSVTLFKAEPITSAEISPYLSSTEVASKVDTSRIYATMSYYSRDNCVSAGDQSGCSIDYSLSDIKQVVDIWAAIYTNLNDLVTDSTGYKARLMTYDEITDIVVLEMIQTPSLTYYSIPSSSTWLYGNVDYLTMSQGDDSVSVWRVGINGYLSSTYVADVFNAVRPVITIKKSALE